MPTLTLFAAAALLGAGGATPGIGQAGDSTPPDAARRPAYGTALARIGRSGLRGLLSSSGSLGDLRNRAGSHRLAARLERARTAALRGRIEALDRALADPDLPPGERARILALRDAAREEVSAVPTYEAAYRATTVQLEALDPFGSLGDGPLFLMTRVRGHGRWDRGEGLTVSSLGATVGPVLALDRWVFAPGLAVGRTDVDILPFEGKSGTTSVGPTLSVGRLLADRWSGILQLSHVRAWGTSTIRRPGPDGPTEVRTEGRSRTTTARLEVIGRHDVPGPDGPAASVRPRAGLFVRSTRAPEVTDSRGKPAPGSFGERETITALRAGVSVDTDLGAWSPSLYLGWEREFADEMNGLIDDPQALLSRAGLTWRWARGRRLSLDFSLLRGTGGRRQVSELTLVAILDG